MVSCGVLLAQGEATFICLSVCVCVCVYIYIYAYFKKNIK
jgi:hypothetical protein